jgi:hypothetical protein
MIIKFESKGNIKRLPTKQTVVKSKNGAFVRNQHVKTKTDLDGHMDNIQKIIDNSPEPKRPESGKLKSTWDNYEKPIIEYQGHIKNAKDHLATLQKDPSKNKDQIAQTVETIGKYEDYVNKMDGFFKEFKKNNFDSARPEVDAYLRKDGQNNPDLVKDTYEFPASASSDFKDSINDSMSDISTLMSPDVLKKLSKEKSAKFLNRTKTGKYRSNYHNGKTTISMGTKDKSTVGHEYGHHIDSSLKDVGDKVHQ